jgi:hypothetical protein
MSELVKRIEEVARVHALATMPTDPSGVLPAMSLRDLLQTYGNWKARLVPPRPRAVHISAEFAASPEMTRHNAELNAIVAKIKSGSQLRPHLSKRVRVAHDPATKPGDPLQLRRDRDLLIADWGIHHLHISLEEEANGSGFVKRGGPLLFAIFRPEDAYLIGVFSHGDWALKEVLEIVVRNWPNSGLVLDSKTGLVLTHEYTDDERLELRNCGIATPSIMVDGKMWSSTALGQTLDGSASPAACESAALMHVFREWREHTDERLAEAARQVDALAGRAVTAGWEPIVIRRASACCATARSTGSPTCREPGLTAVACESQEGAVTPPWPVCRYG